MHACMQHQVGVDGLALASVADVVVVTAAAATAAIGASRPGLMMVVVMRAGLVAGSDALIDLAARVRRSALLGLPSCSTAVSGEAALGSARLGWPPNLI
jgi:hypothetical protein